MLSQGSALVLAGTGLSFFLSLGCSRQDPTSTPQEVELIASSHDLYDAVMAVGKSVSAADMLQLNSTRISSYYGALLDSASNDPLTVDGDQVQHILDKLTQRRDYYAQLDANFHTMGGLWQAIFANTPTATITEAEFTSGLHTALGGTNTEGSLGLFKGLFNDGSSACPTYQIEKALWATNTKSRQRATGQRISQIIAKVNAAIAENNPDIDLKAPVCGQVLTSADCTMKREITDDGTFPGAVKYTISSNANPDLVGSVYVGYSYPSPYSGIKSKMQASVTLGPDASDPSQICPAAD